MAANNVLEKATAAPAVSTPAKGKKIPTAALKHVQQQQETRRKAEEEARRLEEEERKQAEEEERLRQEEEKRIAEIKARKKEKEKEKKEQLRKEGKLLTKTQREARQREQARLQALLDSGVKIAGLQEGVAKKTKPVYDKKKKKTIEKTKVEQDTEDAANAIAEKLLEEQIAAEKAAQEELQREKEECETLTILSGASTYFFDQQ